MRKVCLLLISLLCILSLAACSNSEVNISYDKEDVSFFRGNDGSLTINASGGSGRYEYSIDNGGTWQKSNKFVDLTAGIYRVKVRDRMNKDNIQSEYVLLTQPERSRPEVYVGVADQRTEQIRKPDEWKYVRENADGFYINFIMMDSIYTLSDLTRFANMFTNKNAFIESDMNSTEKKEQGYITKLHQAGFTVTYTSLNYGWELSRQENLKNFDLKEGQAPRPCFVQQGPWMLGGDIAEDNGTGIPFPNSDYRSWIQQADGTSTDGPMGFWVSDQGKMKSGSYSMVKYAHSLGKKSLVMVCPYHAGVPQYTPSMFLEIGSQCVRDHEDNDAVPDIWSVFEYATDIAAVPEQKDGKPFNSTTGMAYYLINHIKGVPGTLSLKIQDNDRKEVSVDPSEKSAVYKIDVSNTSDWCDYAAVIKANVTGLTNAWDIQFKLDGVDITKEVFAGYQFYKENRLDPNTTKTIEIHIKRTKSNSDTEFSLDIDLLPHFGVDKADSVKIVSGN